MTKQDPRVSAIVVGEKRIEYHKPDMALAYSILAPRVSEAWAFLCCGNIEAAKKALASAQSVIETAAITSATIELRSGDDTLHELDIELDIELEFT